MNPLELLRHIGRWGHRAERAPQMARIEHLRTAPERAHRNHLYPRPRGVQSVLPYVPTPQKSRRAVGAAAGATHRSGFSHEHQ